MAPSPLAMLASGVTDRNAGPVRISVFIATSVDGYIADRDGSIAWLEESGDPREDYGFTSFLDTVDALAMGRGTYDHVADLDPLPFGDRPVYVFTSRPPAPRPGVTFWQADSAQAVAHWNSQGHSRIYLDGGRVISDFLAAGLVDDILLTTVPILLGEGLPLFHAVPRRATLTLLDTQTFASGMVNRRYRVEH